MQTIHPYKNQKRVSSNNIQNLENKFNTQKVEFMKKIDCFANARNDVLFRKNTVNAALQKKTEGFVKPSVLKMRCVVKNYQR